jgi:MFS family permease
VSILTSTFAEGPERNKALGIFGAVGGTAASVGVISGGALTTGPGWEWVFFINVPIGLAFASLAVLFIPRMAPARRGASDLVGALTVTAGLMAIVYAINKSVDYDWTSATTLGFLGGGLALLVVFVVVEVLRYSAVDTGVAWVSATFSSVVVAGGIAPRVVGRIGPGATLVVGQGIMASGLLYLTQAPLDAGYWADLFPGFLGIGIGIGFSAMAIGSRPSLAWRSRCPASLAV